MKSKSWLTVYSVLIVVASIAVGCIIGKGQALLQPPKDTSSALTPALQLTVTEDPDTEYSTTLLEVYSKNSFTKVSLYHGITQADITINGEVFSLGEALVQNKITQEEIIYLARTDSRNGHCLETHDTQNGLTHFTYHYPSFNLRVIYDVYEVPNGNEDLINYIVLYPNRDNFILGTFTNFYDPVTREQTDYENWGLTFTVSDPSPSGVIVKCQQAAGQQIGQLSIGCYDICNHDGFVQNQAGTAESPSLDLPVEMNSEMTFTINWSEEYGQLPSGQYEILFHVLDNFEESQVHPLMRDYHDWQVYSLEFTIP